PVALPSLPPGPGPRRPAVLSGCPPPPGTHRHRRRGPGPTYRGQSFGRQPSLHRVALLRPRFASRRPIPHGRPSLTFLPGYPRDVVVPVRGDVLQRAPGVDLAV